MFNLTAHIKPNSTISLLRITAPYTVLFSILYTALHCTALYLLHLITNISKKTNLHSSSQRIEWEHEYRRYQATYRAAD